jgi:excisionase family DNA binding protein
MGRGDTPDAVPGQAWVNTPQQEGSSMPLITTSEASELVKYSESHLRKLARDKQVKARKKGNKWYFDQKSLLTYKARQENSGR